MGRLRASGCADDDILQLMDIFSEKIEPIEKAYMDLAQPESKIASASGKKDIGRSPGKSAGKEPEPFVLRMADMTLFINKVEDVVDSELETLRNYILKNTSERSQTLDLGRFYDHVYLWAEGIWQERNGVVVEDPHNEDDSVIDPAKETALSLKSPGKGLKALSDDQKEVSYTV